MHLKEETEVASTLAKLELSVSSGALVCCLRAISVDAQKQEQDGETRLAGLSNGTSRTPLKRILKSDADVKPLVSMHMS